MSQIADADPCASIRSAYDNVVSNVNAQHPLNYIPTFKSVQSRLTRIRASAFPPVPRTIQEVALTGEWTQTWHDQNFSMTLTMCVILLFSLLIQLILRMLASCSVIFSMEHFAPPRIRITTWLLSRAVRGSGYSSLFLFDYRKVIATVSTDFA